MEIEWIEISSTETTIFENAMNLYEQAFSIEVREPQKVFRRSLESIMNDDNNYRFLAGMEDQQVIAFATGHYFADVNTGFIVYIVTDPNVRSRGLGYKTLAKLEELLNDDAIRAGNSAIDMMILETETEEMVHTKKEKEDCIKRNNFFKRNNYIPIYNIEYKQPPLYEGDSSIPLNLFVKNQRKSELTMEVLHNTIFSTYQEKYYFINQINKVILDQCIQEMGINRSIIA